MPAGLGGAGVVLLGVAISWLGLTAVSHTLSKRGKSGEGALGGLALATLVAIGIGLHNFGEGLAIGTSFALSELALGSFLIVGFMIHNITEGLGIAAPIADGGRGIRLRDSTTLTLVAGAPAILGAWLGGFITNDLLAVLFFAAAAGAAFQVVTEVGPLRRAQGTGRDHVPVGPRRLHRRDRRDVRHGPDRGLAAVRADAQIRTGDPFITSEVLYQLSYVGERLSLALLFRHLNYGACSATDEARGRPRNPRDRPGQPDR